jgi:NAD(P)-dependent dehydrogenase (short-subunit alcohol dehydrogenase family)
MDLQLKGKKVLVTGSTAGIGLAIAKSLAGEGASVIVNGRAQARVDAAVKEVIAEFPGSEISGVAADLSSAEGVAAVTGFVPDLDILVNNMGIFEVREFAGIADEDWFKIFEANVMSGIRLSRHYLPRMLDKNKGRLIFISSESAINIPVEMIHYGMTKTAQLAVSRGLAEMTAGTNVTVNSILPGPTASEGVGSFMEQVAGQQKVSVAEAEADFFKTVRPSSLIKRFAQPKEVGDFVAFVASPISSAINGAALRVDGGTVKSIV